MAYVNRRLYLRKAGFNSFQWENCRFTTFEISLIQQEISTENQFDILMAHYKSTAFQQEITGLEYLAYLSEKKCRRS